MGQENVASKQSDTGDNPVLIALSQFDPNYGNLFDSMFLCFSPPLTTSTKFLSEINTILMGHLIFRMVRIITICWLRITFIVPSFLLRYFAASKYQ